MITFACASPSSSSYCVVIRQIFSPFPPIKFNPAGVCYATLNFKRIFFSIFKRGPSSRTSFRHCWPCHRSDLRTYMSDGVSSQRAGIEPAGCIRCKVECLIFLYIYNIYSRWPIALLCGFACDCPSLPKYFIGFLITPSRAVRYFPRFVYKSSIPYATYTYVFLKKK